MGGVVVGAAAAGGGGGGGGGAAGVVERRGGVVLDHRKRAFSWSAGGRARISLEGQQVWCCSRFAEVHIPCVAGPVRGLGSGLGLEERVDLVQEARQFN